MEQVHPRLPITREQLADFCRRHHIVEFALFGSITRDDYRPDSDIDVMVQFASESRTSLWDVVGIRDELVELFGREVDIMTKWPVRNPYRRASIEKDLTVIYAA